MTKVAQLIISDESTLGNGKNMDSPIRVITKILDFEGNEIARHDPKGNYTIEDLIAVAKYYSTKDPIKFEEGHWHSLLEIPYLITQKQ